MSNLPQKTIKQGTKPLQKNKASIQIYIYKAKMQTSKQITPHTITQYGCAHTIQNAEMKQAKNCNTHFRLIMQKNQEQNTKKPKTKHSCMLKYM